MNDGRIDAAAVGGATTSSRGTTILGTGRGKQQLAVGAVSSLEFRARRLTEESGTDVLVQEVLELLERMRVDLNQLKGSIDLRENTERAMSSRAARQSMALRRMTEPKQECTDAATSKRPSCTGFLFVPMATAPLVGLTLRGAHSEEEEEAVQRQQRRLPLQRLQGPDVGLVPNSPQWNASTCLRDDTKCTKTTEKVTEAGAKRTTHPSGVVRERWMKTAVPTPPGDAGWDELSTSLVCSAHFPRESADGGSGATIHSWSLGDAQKVRDYLRRLNIVTRQPTETEERIDDPVLNGVVLRRLVLLALRGDGSGTEENAFNPPLVPKPKNLEDVRLNYLSALSALRAVEKDSSLCIPRECRLIRPEGVIVRGDSRALFLLLRTLIDSCLPSSCESLWSSPSLTWQPIPGLSSYKPSALRSLELAVCGFLYSQDVLTDPAAHRLPPDDAIVPDALHAPFLPPQRSHWCIRKGEFLSLYIPSVFPFLTNGTVLCDLVEGITGGHLHVHRNPRVNSNCIENIQTAFAELQKFCPARMSPLFIDEPHRVFYGDRWYILMLLEDIMRLSHGAPPRRQLPRPDDVPYLGPVDSSSATHSTLPPPAMLLGQSLPLTSSELHSHHPAYPLAKSPARGKSDRGTPQSAEHESPRCVIASPISRTAAVLGRSAKPLRTRSPPAPKCELRSPTHARDLSPVTLSGMDFTEEDVSAMIKWLAAALGPDFRYTAADHSFSLSSHDLQLHERPLLFSDGVVLAHLIRTLERRRCSELETIEVSAKSSAAKRRNIRKCISFLQTERRVLLNIPLLDEILLSGDRHGVLYVIHCLKGVYRFAFKG